MLASAAVGQDNAMIKLAVTKVLRRAFMREKCKDNGFGDLPIITDQDAFLPSIYDPLTHSKL